MNKEHLYLDYNATSPLSQNVKAYLAKGDLLFANPSSVHSLGKQSRKVINNTISYLEEFFNLSNHSIVFNSGATESINTVVRSMLDENGENFFYICFNSDHASSRSMLEYVKSRGADGIELKNDNKGLVVLDELNKVVNEQIANNKTVLLNITWVNSEIGVVQDLEEITQRLVSSQNLFIHVDAVQSVGKIKEFEKLIDDIHFYTYSAHKFGGMKGVGFTLVRKDVSLSPLILGGGQQGDLRSGTENILGIHSVKLALEDLTDNLDIGKSLENRDALEKTIESILESNGHIVAKSSPRACNTISVALNEHKADETLIFFDMNKIAISAGSACSSSSLKKSPSVANVSGEELADKSVRISLPLSYAEGEFNKIKNQFTKVLSQFLK